MAVLAYLAVRVPSTWPDPLELPYLGGFEQHAPGHALLGMHSWPNSAACQSRPGLPALPPCPCPRRAERPGPRLPGGGRPDAHCGRAGARGACRMSLMQQLMGAAGADAGAALCEMRRRRPPANPQWGGGRPLERGECKCGAVACLLLSTHEVAFLCVFLQHCNPLACPFPELRKRLGQRGRAALWNSIAELFTKPSQPISFSPPAGGDRGSQLLSLPHLNTRPSPTPHARSCCVLCATWASLGNLARHSPGTQCTSNYRPNKQVTSENPRWTDLAPSPDLLACARCAASGSLCGLTTFLQ